jgi:hypothetical protein
MSAAGDRRPQGGEDIILALDRPAELFSVTRGSSLEPMRSSTSCSAGRGCNGEPASS